MTTTVGIIPNHLSDVGQVPLSFVSNVIELEFDFQKDYLNYKLPYNIVLVLKILFSSKSFELINSSSNYSHDLVNFQLLLVFLLNSELYAWSAAITP